MHAYMFLLAAPEGLLMTYLLKNVLDHDLREERTAGLL